MLRARRDADEGSEGIDWDDWTSDGDGDGATALDDEDAFAAFATALAHVQGAMPDRFQARRGRAIGPPPPALTSSS